MSEWAAHLDRHWFAVALSSKVGRKPVRVMLLDRPIVLVRLDGRRVTGLRDCCPHRHAPLSRGRIVDGTLQCPYHGWRFDAQGALRELPGAPPDACLPGVHAQTVALIEHDGVIWVRLAADGDHDIPARARMLAPAQRRFLWQTTWHAHVLDALENVLDPLHTHFVHAGLVRRHGARHPVEVHVRPDAQGFEVDYVGASTQSGLLYRLFESPREAERSAFSAPATAQIHYHYRNGSRTSISMHFSPESGDRTRLIGMLHLEGRHVPAWAVRAFVWPFIRRVALQDSRMLALQADNRRAFPEPSDVVTRFDIVRRRLQAVWSAAADPSSSATGDTSTTLML